MRQTLIRILAGPNDTYRGSLAIDSICAEHLDHRPVLRKFYMMAHVSMLALRWACCAAQRGVVRLLTAVIARSNIADPLTASARAKQGTHAGQRCFILANGSSLRKQDLSPLQHEHTIAIGTYWRHEANKTWQPTYYTMVDAHLFTPERDEVPGTTVKSVAEMAQAVHDSDFFFPYSAHKFFRQHPFVPQERLNYVHLLPHPLYEQPMDYPSFDRGFPWVQDSSQFAIMLAMALGYTEIILLGCDHDWYVNRGIEKHFFSGPARGEGTEVFDSSRIPYKQSAWFGWVLWRGHEALKRMAESRGVKIVNATGGGVLDVYPLASYEHLVGLDTPASDGGAKEQP